MKLGIERIDAYPATLSLDLRRLCEARGIDDSRLMTRFRSLNPPWEDPVTMAVNAARLVVDDQNRDQIGLVIVATETGVDLEKSISTWVHRYLELRPDVRNFEIKHACYGATAAIQMALGWLATTAEGRKALIVTTDQSLLAIGAPWEPICGGGAVAALLSSQPSLFEFTPGESGVYAQEITDVIRPNLCTETGNSDASMFSYLDALDGAHAAFCSQVEGSQRVFDWHVYHMPFPGLALTAHRAMCAAHGNTSRKAATEDFARRVEPSTRFASQVGGVYSGSWLLGTLSLAEHAALATGQRLAVFSYGSGSCAEFFALDVGEAISNRRSTVTERIAARDEVSIDTYEQLERQRTEFAGAASFRPSTAGLERAWQHSYANQDRLVLRHVEGHFRTYGWS